MRRTKVRELMTGEVVTLQRGQSMPTAQELLRLLRIRHLPVLDREGKLVGLVTHRRLLQAHIDLMARRGEGGEDDPQDKIPVRKVMEDRVHTIGPDNDAAEALELMLNKNVGSLPVVKDGRLVGIVTSKDFLQFQLRRLRDESAGGATLSVADGQVTVPEVTLPVANMDRQTSPTAASGVRRVLTGVLLLGLGLGLGLLVARLVGGPLASSSGGPGPSHEPAARADARSVLDAAPAAVGPHRAASEAGPDGPAESVRGGTGSSDPRRASAVSPRPDARAPASPMQQTAREVTLPPPAPPAPAPPAPSAAKKERSGWVPEPLPQR